jgi:hypothetical protein
MRFEFRFLFVSLAAGVALLATPFHSYAQNPASDPAAPDPVAEIQNPPDAPTPQIAVAASEPAGKPADPPAQTESSQSQPQSTPGSTAAQNPPAQNPPAQNAPDQNGSQNSGQSSSSSSAPTQQPAEQTQQQKAQQQVKEEEKQRVLGLVPAFNITYRNDTVSLTPAQKIDLAFHSAIDPATFGIAFIVAGLHEALDDDTGFRWGIEGYGRRSGAAYLDAFDGTMIGNGFLPVVFRQDPRYFRLGHGSTTHRLLYAMATSFICRHDNTGKWEPNYSNVLGNIAAGALSNLYYPDSNTGVGLTISNGFIVTAEGMAGGVFAEFWPDLSRHFLHRDPTHGQDAEARALDAQEKQERKDAKEKQKQQQQPQQAPPQQQQQP